MVQHDQYSIAYLAIGRASTTCYGPKTKYLPFNFEQIVAQNLTKHVKDDDHDAGRQV